LTKPVYPDDYSIHLSIYLVKRLVYATLLS